MIDNLMPDIPRIYTALAEWIACLIFIFQLKKRFEWWKSAFIIVGMLIVQSAFLVSTGNVLIYFWIPCMIIAVFFMIAFIHLCCDVNFRDAGYFGMIAFVVAEFMASMEWQIVCSIWTRQLPGTYACSSLWCSCVFIMEVIAAAFAKGWKTKYQSQGIFFGSVDCDSGICGQQSKFYF